MVDSRAAEDAAAIRRRRECLRCGCRFTTYERVEELPLVVLKGDGSREPFDRTKVAAGVRLAATGRPVDDATIDELAVAVEDDVRDLGPEVDRRGRDQQVGGADPSMAPAVPASDLALRPVPTGVGDLLLPR